MEQELPLNRTTLGDPRALAALGMLAAKALKDAGICSLFINTDGDIEVIMPGELELDLIQEPIAVRLLMEKGYTEPQLVAYLKGRDSRSKLRGK